MSSPPELIAGKKHTLFCVIRFTPFSCFPSLGGNFSMPMRGNYCMPADTVAENLVRFVGAVFLISHYNLKLTLIAMIVLALFFEVARWYVARSERRV